MPSSLYTDENEVEMLAAGVYEHDSHPDSFYLLIGLARDHDTDDEYVVYIPLRVDPEWAGSARMALRPLDEFLAKFTYRGLRLP